MRLLVIIGIALGAGCTNKHSDRLGAVDLSTPGAAARSLCLALEDGQQDILKRVLGENPSETMEKGCMIAIQFECKYGSGRSYADCQPPYPECSASNVSARFDRFSKAFRASGSKCKVTRQEDDPIDTVRISTYKGVEDRLKFEQQQDGRWIPAFLLLEMAERSWLSDRLKEERERLSGVRE